MRVHAPVFLLLTTAAAFAVDPIPVSVQQLLDKPRRYENKLVAVKGYFDATEWLLSARRNADMAIVLDFTRTQGKKLKKENKVYSGFVQVVGVFEYIDTTPRFIRHLGGASPEGERDLYQTHMGFRGAFPSQITGIKEFAHLR